MRAQELIEYLSGEIEFLINKGVMVFPDPNYMPDVEESQLPALFVFGSGGSEPDDELPMEFPSFQIIVKGKSQLADSTQMDKTEQLAKSLMNHLKKVNHQFIGSNLVYYIRPIQSSPIPIGLDMKDRPVYSTNFRLRVQPIQEGSN
jgi:hypothetical protein